MPIDTLLGYIDPGAGTILLQVIFAGLLGGAAYFRKWIWLVLSFSFRRNKQEPSGENGPQ